jgi:alpha-L-rhamnosidase
MVPLATGCTVAGLDTYDDGPGYKHIKIKPFVGGGFTHATASLQTYYGTLSSGWKVATDKTVFTITIPPNTTATVYLPATATAVITEGGKFVSAVKDITVTGMQDGYMVLKVGSGKYNFEVKQ